MAMFTLTLTFNKELNPKKIQGCLTLAPNGRVVPKFGQACEESLPTLCEYQACYTHDGFPCIFPFKYKDVEYRNCSSTDLYEPWCPTGEKNFQQYIFLFSYFWRGTVQHMSNQQPLSQQPILDCGV